nr:hypothetical protein [uncultured Campylobacter sp.]
MAQLATHALFGGSCGEISHLKHSGRSGMSVALKRRAKISQSFATGALLFGPSPKRVP